MRNLVFDNAGILSALDINKINDVIHALCRDIQGAEIGVEIISSNNGADPHTAGVNDFNRIGLGRSELNNGVLIVFAMNDRHVELILGKRYNSLFDKETSASLLRSSAVSFLKQGKPAEAVLAAVTAAAQEIRNFETDGYVFIDPSAQQKQLLALRLKSSWKFWAALAAVLSSIAGYYLYDHMCSDCRSIMNVTETVLIAPTYSFEGKGERIDDCLKCGHHYVTKYIIPVKDNSTSSSNDDSSWDGGGSADGGGGGGIDW